MLVQPSLNSCVEVLHGDTFSLFCDEFSHYWVICNGFPSVFQGPFSLDLARKIMINSNEYYNSIKLKGNKVL